MLPHHTVRSSQRAAARSMRRRMTPAEFHLWRRLQANTAEGLRFRRQAPIGDYIVDFFCPQANLVVEVDGSQHNHRAGERSDGIRDGWLRAQGHVVLRFTNGDVQNNLDGVCAMILATARERWLDLSSAFPPESGKPPSTSPQG
ncbi:MAG: endonuclease domain-containing protein [Bauldia sp.]|nr:endonuclease domain-containing protein [Bauldia sp.]